MTATKTNTRYVGTSFPILGILGVPADPRGDPMQGFDHVVRPEMAPAEPTTGGNG